MEVYFSTNEKAWLIYMVVQDFNAIHDVKFMVGHVVGRGENAGYQHFLLFPWCLKSPLPQAIVWKRDEEVKLTNWPTNRLINQTKELLTDWFVLHAPFTIIQACHCNNLYIQVCQAFHQW